MQRVQTLNCRCTPLMVMVVRWMFGLNRLGLLGARRNHLLVRACRRMLCPIMGCFPQISQMPATRGAPFDVRDGEAVQLPRLNATGMVPDTMKARNRSR